jgi:DNA replication protein DnaC
MSLQRITLHARHFDQSVLATLQKHYAGLEWCHDDDIITLKAQDLSIEHFKRLSLDIRFFEQNPSLPLENLCAHLETYSPTNSSQEELLTFANKLIALEDDTQGAGLFIYGEAGIGKSHIAIGVSKKFMEKGLQPNFQVAEKYASRTQVRLEPGQVWVIDDMNSGFHFSYHLFKKVVLNAHDRGGRVFVTSNKPYEELMTELFVGDGNANRMRYEDRTKGMFKILNVKGESHRQATAWYL